MKSSKYVLAVLIGIMFLMPPSAMAFLQEVHDSVIYVHNTIKAIQDEAYQQMALDIGADQLGTTGEILKTGLDTLKVTQDTYNTCKETYDTAVDISNYIGDPIKLISYLNSRFWHENEISAALDITRDAMEMNNSSVASTGEIESMLRQVDYGLADVQLKQSENLAETQKGAIAVHKFMSEWGPKALIQLTDLNREDQKYNPRESSLTEMQYAAYRNGIWQSNTLGQMFAAQTAHSAMVAQQLYMENSRTDQADYDRAKAIYDNRNLTEAGKAALESKGAISGNFIDAILGDDE